MLGDIDTFGVGSGEIAAVGVPEVVGGISTNFAETIIVDEISVSRTAGKACVISMVDSMGKPDRHTPMIKEEIEIIFFLSIYVVIQLSSPWIFPDGSAIWAGCIYCPSPLL